MTIRNELIIAALLIAAALAAATLMGGYYYVRALKSELAEANMANAAARANLAVTQKSLVANTSALGRREAERKALESETEDLRQKLEEIYERDEPCQVWSSTDMPDPVYERLRR